MLRPHLLLLLAAPSAALAMDIHTSSAPAGVKAMTAWLETHPSGVEGSFALSGEDFSCLPQGCTQGAGWSLRGDGARGYISFRGDFSGELSPEHLQAQLSYVSLSHRELLPGGWAVGFNTFTPYRREGGGLLVEGCQGRELVLRVTQPTVELSADRPDDPRCQSHSEETASASGCTAYIFDLQIPTALLLRVSIPEEAAVRCPGG